MTSLFYTQLAASAERLKPNTPSRSRFPFADVIAPIRQEVRQRTVSCGGGTQNPGSSAC